MKIFFSVDLDPDIPQGERLADMLTEPCTQMQKQYALDITLKIESIESNLDESLRVLLSNVVKHAETLQATVTLEQVDEQIHITVSDEGVGRQMEVDSKPGAGTYIIIQCPVQAKLEE